MYECLGGWLVITKLRHTDLEYRHRSVSAQISNSYIAHIPSLRSMKFRLRILLLYLWLSMGQRNIDQYCWLSGMSDERPGLVGPFFRVWAFLIDCGAFIVYIYLAVFCTNDQELTKFVNWRHQATGGQQASRQATHIRGK